MTEENNTNLAPETYADFTFPEGFVSSPEFVTSYSEVAKNLGLSQENAQMLIDKVAPNFPKVEKAPVNAPEKYEFKLPEGQQFGLEFEGVYSEVAKELNLSQENAQMLIDKVGPVIEKDQMTRVLAVQNQWKADSQADKEFGGSKLEESLGFATKVIEKWGSPALKDLFNKTGLGDHPELIRFAYRIYKDVSPDTFVGGTKPAGAGSKDFNEMANRLYPDQK